MYDSEIWGMISITAVTCKKKSNYILKRFIQKIYLKYHTQKL